MVIYPSREIPDSISVPKKVKITITPMHTIISNETLNQYIAEFNDYLKPLGLFLKPFLVSQYNQKVEKNYQLTLSKYQPHDNTVCFTIASNAIFCGEIMKKFAQNLPYDMEREYKESPVHCITKYFLKQFMIAKLYEKFGYNIEILYDFDMINNRPRILIQTAGHVSSLAYFYHPKNFGFSDLKYGCSLHPIYGGWFGFRGAIVLKDVICNDFQIQSPIDVFGNNIEETRYFLELFNAFDPRWRDVVPSLMRYDQEQINFFNTPPSLRSVPGLEASRKQIHTRNIHQHTRELSSSSFADKDHLIHESTDLHDEPNEYIPPRKVPELSVLTAKDNSMPDIHTPATLRHMIDAMDQLPE